MESQLYQLEALPEEHPGQFDFQPEEPVETGLKWMLITGRLLGVNPLSMSLRPRQGNVKFRWTSFSMVHSLALTFLALSFFIPHTLNFYRKAGTHATIMEEMFSLQDLLFRFSILANYVYWLRNARRLIRVFHKWSSTMNTLKLISNDNRFPKFCLKISLFTIVPFVMEGALGDLDAKHRNKDGKDYIETVYNMYIWSIAKYLPPYSPFFAFPLYICFRLGFISWIFSDAFVIVMCRAIHGKFMETDRELHSALLQMQWKSTMTDQWKRSNINQQPFDILVLREHIQQKELFWKGVRMKILKLCELSEEVTNFVAPLVTSCYVFSIFRVMTIIIQFIYDSEAFSFFVYVSFALYAIRVVLVTYFSAQVHSSPNLIKKTLVRCPDSLFCPTAGRLEQMLGESPIGVVIFGIVPITSKMFITIIAFLFTTEIVVLQAMGAVRNNAVSESVMDMGNCSGGKNSI